MNKRIICVVIFGLIGTIHSRKRMLQMPFLQAKATAAVPPQVSIFQPVIYTVPGLTQTTEQIMLQGNAPVVVLPVPCTQITPPAPGVTACPLTPGPLVPNLQFTAAHTQETGTYGPAWDGAVGTTQFLLSAKGRVRSFCKSTGMIDNVLNVSYDKFFSSVNLGFLCADPNVLFDHFNNRWYILCDDGGGSILLAVSDGENSGTLTSQTVWSFFMISNTVLGIPAGYQNPSPDTDSTTLGYDEFSILLAGRTFDFILPTFLSGAVYILPKQLLNPNSATVYAYLNLTDQKTKNGPDCTQAVTNFDTPPAAAYFLGINTATNFFPAGPSNFLWLDSVQYNASQLPTVLVQTPVPVLPFSGPVATQTLGSPKGVVWVDAEVSRGSHVRNGELIFTQNISVNSNGDSGVSIKTTQNAARYYRINPVTFTVLGTGTLFDPAGTSYVTPSLMSNTNGDIVIGATVMGPQHFLDATLVAVPANDGEFTFTPPVMGYTTSNTPYYSTDDWEFVPFSRWGDHSRTTLDPVDSVSFWTAQGFCLDSNTW
jgi:hypothetical protein